METSFADPQLTFNPFTISVHFTSVWTSRQLTCSQNAMTVAGLQLYEMDGFPIFHDMLDIQLSW